MDCIGKTPECDKTVWLLPIHKYNTLFTNTSN